MDLTLLITTGDDAGRRIAVPPGTTMAIGRSAEADVRCQGDPLMSARHFAIDRTGETDWLRDLGSRFGTSINGLKLAEGPIAEGDVIVAGRTSFTVRGGGGGSPVSSMDTATPAPVSSSVTVTPAPVNTFSLHTTVEPPPRELSAMHRKIVSHLRSKPGTLFGLLDAAREPSVIARMQRAGHEHQCLYDGDKGDDFSAYGPWLVHLPTNSPLVDELVGEGWGHSWGVYLTSEKPFKDVRRHLRQFLLVKLPDGREVFFRFYDPRVLRTYLPTCTEAEVKTFVGPLTYVVESVEEGEVLEYAANYHDWKLTGLLK